jgi:endonuclease I
MKKGLRNLVLNLPGPPSSYCTCDKLCSSIQIDHVVPQKFLKEKINKNLKNALNDPHNLYRCCSNKNKQKGHSLLNKKEAGNDFSGLLARSYLYMIWKYDIEVSKEFLTEIKTMNNLHSPFVFERNREAEIRSHTNQGNPFINRYPTIKDKY